MSSKTKTIATKEAATPALVPKLRFPEFRGAESWEPKTLAEICLQITNGKANAQDHEEDGDYPLFDRSAVIKKSSEFMFDAEAVILPGEGMRFIPKYFQGKFNLHQRAYALMRHQGDGRFVYHSLDYLQDALAKKAVKSTVPSLRLPIVQDFVIGCPKPAEQQKIAECLSSVDELMAAQARKVEALKTHKKGLMQQLFPREGETQPRLRFPEFENAGEWKCKTLKDIARITSGSTPLRSNPEFFVGGTIPWVKTTDLNNSFIDETEEKITPKARARINPAGSVLIAMYGGFNQIGRTGCLSFPAATNQAISVLALDRKAAMPAYVLAWLNAKVEDWKRIASSSRKDPNITSSDVAKFTIVLPELDEQQRIASCLSSLDVLITLETQKLEALKTHKKGLTQQLFPSPEEVEA